MFLKNILTKKMNHSKQQMLNSVETSGAESVFTESLDSKYYSIPDSDLSSSDGKKSELDNEMKYGSLMKLMYGEQNKIKSTKNLISGITGKG